MMTSANICTNFEFFYQTKDNMYLIFMPSLKSIAVVVKILDREAKKIKKSQKKSKSHKKVKKSQKSHRKITEKSKNHKKITEKSKSHKIKSHGKVKKSQKSHGKVKKSHIKSRKSQKVTHKITKSKNLVHPFLSDLPLASSCVSRIIFFRCSLIWQEFSYSLLAVLVTFFRPTPPRRGGRDKSNLSLSLTDGDGRYELVPENVWVWRWFSIPGIVLRK